MANKIIILLASPHHTEGNTGKAAGWAAEGAKEAGATVETIDLTKLDFKTAGCGGCMSCQQRSEYQCVIKDQASDLLARLPEANVVLFATPVYWGGPTAQLKRFMDRMFSLVKMTSDGMNHALTNTRFALLATSGGQLDEGLSLTEKVFEFACVASAGELIPLLIPNAHEREDGDISAIAKAFGQTLAKV